MTIADSFNAKAKLTGAGGGGCALVYLPATQAVNVEELTAKLAEKGFDTWVTALGAQGLRREG